MTYAIQADSTNHINRWEFTKYVPSTLLNQYIFVDTLPEGNLPDYQYINGEFIYNPLPKIEEIIDNIPSQLDVIEAQVTYTAMMTGTLLEQ